MKKFKINKQTVRTAIKNSTNKIKKQGGSPSEISNKRKTANKIIRDATRELQKLSKQFGKK